MTKATTMARTCRIAVPGAAAVVWLMGAAGATAVGAERQDGQAAAESAAAMFSRVCGDCHDLPTVTAARRERAQWEEVIVEMIAEGARVTDEEFDVVLRHLVTHYGRVNVNRAEAPALVEVLGVSDVDAHRILAHRKAHGRFADFDALLEVPEVDVERLKARRNLIVF